MGDMIRLREWRDKRHLSVRQLARLAGVGFATVSRIEHGHMSPTVALLRKLARALECDVRDLLEPSKRRRGKGR